MFDENRNTEVLIPLSHPIKTPETNWEAYKADLDISLERLSNEINHQADPAGSRPITGSSLRTLSVVLEQYTEYNKHLSRDTFEAVEQI